MQDPSFAARAHRNLMEVSARMGEAPGGSVVREAQTLLFASRSPLPFLNGAMRAGPGAGADALLARARDFFFGLGRGFVTYGWPGDPELEAAALRAGMEVVVERYPEMACRRRLEVLAGDVRMAQTEADAVAYWDLCDRAYPSIGLPPGLFTETFGAPDLLADGQTAFLGYLDGIPVACASVVMAEGLGMISWVAAVPEARGRGLAAACTVRATNSAFDLGADGAVLQASTMGEDLYRRLGYEDLFAYRVLGAMPPAQPVT